jgi:chromate reductase, NAD(P)H dehydrogenase (quinone)
MKTYRVGYLVGSLSSTSINRVLSRALVRLAPRDLEFVEVPIGSLPLYSPDYDAGHPREVQALKDLLASVDAVLFVTPEHNRSLPGAPKNAIDWASRPWDMNSFARKPAAMIGASIGKIGTAVAQQHLKSVLSFCDAPQMSAPEAYIQFEPGLFKDSGEVTDPTTAKFLADYMHGRGYAAPRMVASEARSASRPVMRLRTSARPASS